MDVDRRIPAGGRGKISVKVRTAGTGGRMLRKTLRVHSNDPRRPVVTLSVQGDVLAAVTVVPDRIQFRGYADDVLKKNVRIAPGTGAALSLGPPAVRMGKDIRVDLSPVSDATPGVYLLTVTCIRKTPGRFDDTITISTGVPMKPKITIPVTGIILEHP